MDRHIFGWKWLANKKTNYPVFNLFKHTEYLASELSKSVIVPRLRGLAKVRFDQVEFSECQMRTE